MTPVVEVSHFVRDTNVIRAVLQHSGVIWHVVAVLPAEYTPVKVVWSSEHLSCHSILDMRFIERQVW